MKFYVRRASVDYIIDMTPEENAREVCKEAKFEEVEDPGEYGDKFRFFVHLNTLEELMAFEKKYGCIIISGDKEPEIMIYDDYVE